MRQHNLIVVLVIAVATLRNVNAGPAYAPFKSFGNFTRRTDLCTNAALVANGEVCTITSSERIA